MLVCSGHGKHNGIFLARRTGSVVFNVGVNRTYCGGSIGQLLYFMPFMYLILQVLVKQLDNILTAIHDVLNER